ncbi:MAG: TM1266 family iron-only hydrogenase system putative regulator [Anaerovoracaceae bacterium]
MEEKETRVALLGIIIDNNQSAEKLNGLLGEYRQYIIGRMGIPYEKKGISIISIAMDAPADIVSALSGKIGRLDGVSIKAVYSKL